MAQDKPNLSSLVTALTKFPDLVTTLGGTVKFTVFAPTNDAFTALLQTIGQTSINDVPEPVLKSLLQYHVITSGAILNFTALIEDNGVVHVMTATGRVFSSDLVTGSVPALNGNISISATAGTVTSGNGTVANISTNAALVNVLGTNGVIHKINKVLLPSGK